MGVGLWSQDVTYLISSSLSTSLSIEDLRAPERELLRGYLRELQSIRAAASDDDQAW